MRIHEIDKYSDPWFACRFWMKNGKWEYHHLGVYDSDNNWVIVKSRHKTR